MWRDCEGCCYPTESTGFSLRPATSGPIWIQSGSTGGSLTQVNINPSPCLSISPITINHYSLHPSLTTASACQLLSVTSPFYCMISLPAERARKGPIHLPLHLQTQWPKRSFLILLLSVSFSDAAWSFADARAHNGSNCWKMWGILFSFFSIFKAQKQFLNILHQFS